MTRAADGLARFNAWPAAEAERALLSCCAAPQLAAAVIAGRPYADAAALRRAVERVFDDLDSEEVRTAMAAHPRIGERPAGGDRESDWSRNEQAGVKDADARVRAELHAGNLAYEERFGHVFLICASGLSAGQLLAALRRRLTADPETEWRTARAELRKIVLLRLTRLLESS